MHSQGAFRLWLVSSQLLLPEPDQGHDLNFSLPLIIQTLEDGEWQADRKLFPRVVLKKIAVANVQAAVYSNMLIAHNCSSHLATLEGVGVGCYPVENSMKGARQDISTLSNVASSSLTAEV
jgi:hypothetical protein